MSRTDLVPVPKSELKKMRAALKTSLQIARDEYAHAQTIRGAEKSLETYYYAEQVEQIRQAVATVDAKLSVTP